MRSREANPARRAWSDGPRWKSVGRGDASRWRRALRMNGRAASGNNCGRNPQFRRGRLAVLHLLVMQGSGTLRRKTGAQGREAPRPRRRHQPGEKRHQSKVYGGTSAIGFVGTGRRPPSVFGSCTTRFCLMPSGDSDGKVWRTTSIGPDRSSMGCVLRTDGIVSLVQDKERPQISMSRYIQIIRSYIRIKRASTLWSLVRA